METTINGYSLLDNLTTENAGMCLWGFALKNGHEYFLKEFLSPKYPVDEGKLGPELTKIMRESADQFFAKKQNYYDKLRTCRTGNVVVNLDFFRDGSKYYGVTDKISGSLLKVSDVAKLSDDSKYTLLMALYYSLAKIHEAGIVHSDLKPENILIKATKAGYCTAKIIDFDAGFLEEDVPEKIEGSQNYFAPEAVLRTNGVDVAVTTKADIFALGLLTHQFWCGAMPGFSNQYHYISEAVLKDMPISLHPMLPEDIRELIVQMLSKDPADRPTAGEAWTKLRGEVRMPENIAVSTASADTPETPPSASSGLFIPTGNELD